MKEEYKLDYEKLRTEVRENIEDVSKYIESKLHANDNKLSWIALGLLFDHFFEKLFVKK